MNPVLCLLLLLLLLEVQLAELPVAPPPPPKDLTDEEIKVLSKQRQAVLRELRVFLRDATNKLLAERKFKEFTKPVDIEEVSTCACIVLV